MKLVKLSTITTFALSALAFSNTAQADVSYRAIKLNHECGGADTNLGAFNFTEECATACQNTDGCEYFIFGKGDKKGHCFHEEVDVTGDRCDEGWEVDEYDFYELEENAEAIAGFTAQLIIESADCGNGWDFELSTDSVNDCANECGDAGKQFFSFANENNRCFCAGKEQSEDDDECQLRGSRADTPGMTFDDDKSWYPRYKSANVYVALPNGAGGGWWQKLGVNLMKTYKWSWQYTWKCLGWGLCAAENSIYDDPRCRRCVTWAWVGRNRAAGIILS